MHKYFKEKQADSFILIYVLYKYTAIVEKKNKLNNLIINKTHLLQVIIYKFCNYHLGIYKSLKPPPPPNTHTPKKEYAIYSAF